MPCSKLHEGGQQILSGDDGSGELLDTLVAHFDAFYTFHLVNFDMRSTTHNHEFSAISSQTFAVMASWPSSYKRVKVVLKLRQRLEVFDVESKEVIKPW